MNISIPITSHTDKMPFPERLPQSAKRHGLNAFTYLKSIIARISDHPANQLHQLLPDKWTAK